MVDLLGQHLKIKSELDLAISTTIASSVFIGGSAVEQFSERLQKLLNVNHVIGCANGTDALQLALMALDLPPDAEIIVPDFTFVAPAEVVALLGYKPVFTKVCNDTYHIQAAEIEKNITTNTRAIIVVHLFGQCADMQPILALAKKYNLYVIEDTAQSLGATCQWQDGSKHYAGTMGHIGTTSFFPTKNLGAMGDGGAVCTQDSHFATRIKTLANHGSVVKYSYQSVGINSRLDSLQAAILNVKLTYFDQYLANRKMAAAQYLQYLSNSELLKLPKERINTPSTFNQFTIQTPHRDALKKYLQTQGIPSMVYYPSLLSSQPAFQKWNNQSMGQTSQDLCQSVLSLPMHTELDQEQIAFICKNVLLGLEKLTKQKSDV